MAVRAVHYNAIRSEIKRRAVRVWERQVLLGDSWPRKKKLKETPPPAKDEKSAD